VSPASAPLIGPRRSLRGHCNRAGALVESTEPKPGERTLSPSLARDWATQLSENRVAVNAAPEHMDRGVDRHVPVHFSTAVERTGSTVVSRPRRSGWPRSGSRVLPPRARNPSRPDFIRGRPGHRVVTPASMTPTAAASGDEARIQGLGGGVFFFFFFLQGWYPRGLPSRRRLCPATARPGSVLVADKHLVSAMLPRASQHGGPSRLSELGLWLWALTETERAGAGLRAQPFPQGRPSAAVKCRRSLNATVSTPPIETDCGRGHGPSVGIENSINPR